jgi:protoporphyrinogen oxidase
MTPHEKVTKYVTEHVGPFTTQHLANYFLIGKTSVLEALRSLERDNKIIRQRTGNKTIWKKLKLVAVSTKTFETPSSPTHHRPIQNSYPFVRGYDD